MLRKAAPSNAAGPAGPWRVRVLTLLVWALTAGSVAYWWMRLAGPSGQAAAVPVASAADAPLDPMAVARVLGATQQVATVVAAPAPNRYVLTGVVADRRRGGAALIAIGGQPPKPYRVGAELEPGVRLAAVGPRKAVLAAGADAQPLAELELPPLTRQ